MALVTISGDLHFMEVGAQIMGVLAFPYDRQKRELAAKSWCAEVVQADMADFPEIVSRLRQDFGPYAAMKPWEIRRGLRSAKTQLRYRGIAARMSRGFFFENVFGRPAQLPGGMPRLSLNQLSVLVRDEAHTDDPENIEKRVWRSSRHVIHLAAALDREAGAFPSNDNDVRIHDHELMARVLRRAEWHEQFVLKDRRFGVSEDDLIRVRVV